MANEVSWRHTATAKTVYYTIRSAARQMWNTSGTPAFEALTVVNWADYDIALAETPASSYFYVGDWPAGVSTVGWYWLDVYEQATASPAISDTLIGGIIGYWNSTTLSPWAADVTQISGDSTAADRLEAVLDATPGGAVVDDNDPDPTATAFETNLSEATNDHYNGAFVVFASGALLGQSRRIMDYDGTSKVLSVAVAFTEAPAAGDTFVILGRSE